MRRASIACFLGSLFLLVPPVPGNAGAQKIRVACVGDSITYGAGIESRERDSYPGVLGRLLGPGFEVRNFGVSGATLLKKGDKPYWGLEAFKEASAFAPHLVVIKLGTNDSKPQNWKHKADFRNDLVALLDHFRRLRACPKVFLCKPVPVYRDRWGITDSTVKSEIVPLIERVAKRRRAPLIDLYKALSGLPRCFPDGVHPNAAGAEVMARAVRDAILGSTTGPSGTAAGGPRPNFVVMIADDMGWNDCGAYGHPNIRTPNVDTLAREGMRFDRAFLTTSSCSPSRSSILTGRYPHATGAAELHDPLPLEQVTFVGLLGSSGYYTASAGKWHLGGAAKSKFDRVYGGGPSGCENWVRALEERPTNRPFFLWLAAFDPHRGYQAGTIEKPHSPADAVVPPYLPNVPATRMDLAMYYDEIARLDGFVGRVLAKLDEQGVAGDTLVLFMSDNGRPFPRCKTTVYDSGVRTPLIVRWPGRVKRGTTTGSLVSSVDIAPTILELAGLRPSPTFQGLSFARVLDDPAAAIRKYVFAEHNWHDYSAHKRAVRSERYAFILNAYPDVAGTPPADVVRSPTYVAMRRLFEQGKLNARQVDCFVRPRPIEELYDLDMDPLQLRNLANDREHLKPLYEMRQALDDWRLSTGDFMPPERRPDEFDRETGKRLETPERERARERTGTAETTRNKAE